MNRGARVLAKFAQQVNRLRVRWRALRMSDAAAWNPPAASDIPGFEPRRQREAIAEACRILDADPHGPVFARHWRQSIGLPLLGRDGTSSWLKLVVAPDTRRWSDRQAEIEAGEIFGTVPRPSILRTFEWDADGLHWHAMQFSLAPSPAVSTRSWIARPLASIDDRWLRELKHAIDAISRVPLQRWLVHPGNVARLIARRFGRKAPYEIDEWRTAHGDLNWSNLTAPDFAILDWEFWGAAPRGLDAANLLAHTFNDPDLFRRIEAMFAEDLETPSGVVARLYRYSRRLQDIEAGKLDPREHRRIESETRRLLRR